jgi:hypothetical protein
MKIIILVCLIFFTTQNIHAQLLGCTDPQAVNFDNTATVNNGSCTYNSQTYNPSLVAALSNTLKEISGIIYFKEKILALNDGGNGNKLYFLDTTSAAILQTITVAGAVNVDWEDIAQDSNYVYVADVGNNAHGNRTDLCIYKIDKKAFEQVGDFTIQASSVKKINYSYPDQTDFTSATANNTRFDCEGITVTRGKLHLFTKNWIGNYSVHYSVPLDAGTYTAVRLDSLNTNGILITGADAGAHDELLLTGYSKTLSCAFYLIYGYDNTDLFFNTGNKRQIQLPSVLTSGQLESVCFVNGTHGFIANEFQSTFNVSNKLHSFTTTQWIIDSYKQNPPRLGEPGMLRYNTTLDKYEVFTGSVWEPLN